MRRPLVLPAVLPAVQLPGFKGAWAVPTRAVPKARRIAVRARQLDRRIRLMAAPGVRVAARRA